MADTATRSILRTQRRRAQAPHASAVLSLAGATVRRTVTGLGVRPSGTRHPAVAAAMVLPLAALLVVVFGGWDAVVTQASSVGVMLER
ncbi:hypothetical protein ACH4TU_15110 [Streptomyces physcomitrii]|uniref:hypothetical protein n=1 Tax=Streptomyces physcomitrii TaxID=2724184 RepID=UPI00058C6A06